jgi:hypothetical protein
MTPRIAHQPFALANGWRLLDDLGGDPMGREFALLHAPAREGER